MKQTKQNIHRGEVLRIVIANSGMRITQLVKKVGISRSSYYNHIEDPKLPFETLQEYGDVLKHDFTEDIPGMVRSATAEPNDDELYTLPKTIEEAIHQRDIWKNKYHKLLERHNRLLEEKRG